MSQFQPPQPHWQQTPDGSQRLVLPSQSNAPLYPHPGPQSQYPPQQQPWQQLFYPYPQQPQQRPPKRRHIWRNLSIGCAAALVLALAFLAVAGAATAGHNIPAPVTSSHPKAQPTHKPFKPTVQPTREQATPHSTPTHTALPTPTHAAATPTSIPVSSGPALLGATPGAFITQYGQPNDHSTASSGLYHFQRYSGSNIDFLIIMTDAADGSVYTNRVEDVTAQATDTGADAGWTQTQASATCGAFLPRDAIYKRRVDTAHGYDKIYFSASLAKLFPASAFTDASQNQIQAGYFDVFYLYKISPMIDSCDMIIGTQQTNT